MMLSMIPQYTPWLKKEDLEAVKAVVDSGWITEGKVTAQFETEFAKFIGTEHAVACSNGTIALALAMLGKGIGPGDEVIVPDFTFVATATAANLIGAKPIFVDVDKYLTLDPELFKKAITPKTKAVIPVHIYGQATEMDAINEVAAERDVFVIEDAAEAHGNSYKGKKLGAWGDASCFSFFINKNISSVEGGMVLTNDEDLALRMRMLKNYGRREKGGYNHEIAGYNFRMTDMQSALGLSQLKRFPEIHDQKQRVLKSYKDKLGELVPDPRPNSDVTPWFMNVMVDNAADLESKLKKNEIDCRRFFPPLHSMPFYKQEGVFPVTENAYNHGVSLPSFPLLTEEQISKICSVVKGDL